MERTWTLRGQASLAAPIRILIRVQGGFRLGSALACVHSSEAVRRREHRDKFSNNRDAEVAFHNTLDVKPIGSSAAQTLQ